MEYYSVRKKNKTMSLTKKMDGIEDHHGKENKPDSERQIFSHMQTLDLK
jgi:hypothetical protein